jgi:hypothetical protein
MKKVLISLMLVALVMAGNALATELLFESFETAVPPAGWTTLHLGQGNIWERNGYHAYSGDHSAIIRNGIVGVWEDEWLITPALDTTGLTFLIIELYETGWGWEFHGHAHEILVSTTVQDDPEAFTSVWRVTPGDYPASWLNSTGAEWGHVQFNIDEYIGETIYLAIRYDGAYADNWVVDDFHVFEPSAHDVKAIDLVPDGQTWLAGNDISPQFTVKNIGGNSETFPVELTVAFNGTLFYTEQLTVEDLTSGDETTVVFPAFTCQVGDYELTATTLLPTDVDPSNDVAVAANDCFSGQRLPFGILYTNWDCGPCVSANQALDDWYPMQGNNASLIRVHVSWPGIGDPMYRANIPHNEFLLGMCPSQVTGVPTMYMDNTIDLWEAYPDELWPEMIEWGYAWSTDTGSPLEMSLSYDQSNQEAHVTINVIDTMAEGDYVLYVATTEDQVRALGSNGEEYHNQAFRYLYPDEAGVPIATTLGSQEFTVDLALDPGWDYDKLRATTWVQNIPNGKILNSATMFLTEGVSAVGDPDEVPALLTRLNGAHPNPFNPKTTISFSLDSKQRIKLSVFDLAGKRVAELADGVFAAGDQSVIWNGRDLGGREVASGIYMIYLKTKDQTRMSKMTLVR